MTAEEFLTALAGLGIGAGIMAFPWVVIIFVVAPIVLSLRGDDTTGLQRSRERERDERRRRTERLRELADELENDEADQVLSDVDELLQQHGSGN